MKILKLFFLVSLLFLVNLNDAFSNNVPPVISPNEAPDKVEVIVYPQVESEKVKVDLVKEKSSETEKVYIIDIEGTAQVVNNISDKVTSMEIDLNEIEEGYFYIILNDEEENSDFRKIELEK